MTNTYLYGLEVLFDNLRDVCLNIAPDIEFLEENEYEDDLEELERIGSFEPSTVEEHQKAIFFLAKYLENWFPDDFYDDETQEHYENLLAKAEAIHQSMKNVSLEFCEENKFSDSHLAYMLEHNKNLDHQNRKIIENYLKLKTMFS